jgi:poly-beta-1,6-N-acetyl-D-glucosamine synthase
MIWFIAIGLTLAMLYVYFILYANSVFTVLQRQPIGSFNTDKPLRNNFFSIIIPVRNEATNILLLLQDLHTQLLDQRKFEIIVVDDFSDDNTVALIQQANYTNVQVLKLQHKGNLGFGKKAAITYGISKALGNYIITLDADVRLTQHWLNTIDNFIQQQDDVAAIAAPVLMGGQHTWLDRFQEMDFITMQGVTAVVLFKKWFAMCNGANFIYSKAIFYEVKGFDNINHVASGDDMLLLQKIMNTYPKGVHYLLHKQALAITKTEPTLAMFFKQRIRWASKATSYSNLFIKIVLLIVFLFNCWLLSAIGLGIAAHVNIWHILFLILIVKITVEYIFLRRISGFFEKQFSLVSFVLLQPLHIIYIVISALFSFMPTYTWKGRVTK